jgi:ubiquinone/menaquinone biosynthesis C-methylase UbiE
MTQPDAQAAADEFDTWATSGRAESMADGHRGVTEAAIRNWTIAPDSTVLDVGCGNGWAVQALVNRGAARGLGVDIAPRMVERAQQATANDPRFMFEVAAAERLPFGDGTVHYLLNVESLYYYPDPTVAIAEWARVTAPGGQLAIVVDLYEENPATHAWIDALDIDVHLLSAPQIVEMATRAGWRNVRWEQVLDPRPLAPEGTFEISKYWPSYQMYLNYRETGALVVHAER